ncbi:hypothetical protein ZOSMA_228G00230 [Zostera marina]|uniref:SF4 helicase domain-containing protein n=1 Tax=Zostera marina TaxID=29655 RepID=A0A0K9PIW0_ZOSMR|nr:hypothetical protein ZOSMA_228G00230 [Zostera marina]
MSMTFPILPHRFLIGATYSIPALSHRLYRLQRTLTSVSNRSTLHLRASPKSYCVSLRSVTSVPVSRTAETTGSIQMKEVDVVKERLVQLRENLENNGIHFNWTPGEQYSNLICPKCFGGDSGDRSFSLRIHKNGTHALFSCFRRKCGWSGVLKAESKLHSTSSRPTSKEATKKAVNSKTYNMITKETLKLEPLCKEILDYLLMRGISPETLQRNGVMQRKVNNKVVIAFTYRRDGILVNCNYRDINKKSWQENDAEKILYGIDDIKNATDIIIVESEMDKLSVEEAGYHNCVCVPNGAHLKVSKNMLDKEKDTNYEYLWKDNECFSKASRIILASDSDSSGNALAEEIARRLGKERCWRVKWPQFNEEKICKDANEVLMYLGPDALKKAIDDAEFYPIQGLFHFSDYFHEIDAYYRQHYGYELGVSTGWKSVDEFYKIVPGELTVITGVPNSGKSEWIDSLMCNINRDRGWKFALCSMENKVQEHARKLLEKHIRKPFFQASYGASVERMSISEYERGKQWLDDTFHLIRFENECLPSVDWVLRLAKTAVLRYGIHGLVIDPYNELDHQRKGKETETEYVSQILSKIKRFAQHHACHVWFVAHPKQLQNWSGHAPNMYDISGSAHFINKCDNGIVIHRNRDKELGPIDRVQVCVRKVRNKVIGGIGDAYLSYNRVTGEYSDLSQD